uniref:EF-hand domain-containing protein n=1 Tax=Pyramimonas obovata TaxID=1411642 RepID=A0A7S0RQE3_9CHLO|mmetsp:Transcript_4155/g.8544  ORF Transcript_4155/g.8544 Transcript_4155/m.8544 type:complete len:167 (+) Transcript_4155:179-679(+)
MPPYGQAVGGLTRGQLSELRSIFDYFDTDRDGKFTQPEAVNAARLLACNLEPFRNLHADANVTFLEFVDLVKEASEVDLTLHPFELVVGKFFRSIDVGNKGYITAQELEFYFLECGDVIASSLRNALMDELDPSLDGEKFTLAELKRFLNNRFMEGEFEIGAAGCP